MIGKRTVLDPHGNLLGEVREVTETHFLGLPKLTAPRKLQVIDLSGRQVLTLVCPARLIWRQVIVQDGQGREIGQIHRWPLMRRAWAWLQDSPKPSIELVAGEAVLGSIKHSTGSLRLLVKDPSGAEVARTVYANRERRIGKCTHWLQVLRPLPEPLRILVVASTLAEVHGFMDENEGGG